jgi:hypothetical protein
MYDTALLIALLAITLGLMRFQHVATVTGLVIDLSGRTGSLTHAVARG